MATSQSSTHEIDATVKWTRNNDLVAEIDMIRYGWISHLWKINDGDTVVIGTRTYVAAGFGKEFKPYRGNRSIYLYLREV